MCYTKVENDPKDDGMVLHEWECAYTSPPRVNRGVALIVKVWLIQVAKGFDLQLSILEEVQLGEKGQAHKPELENTHKHKHSVSKRLYKEFNTEEIDTHHKTHVLVTVVVCREK